MSQWFDQSNNANKLRQSYLKGFLDISGGGIYMRSDNSLNFYTTEDGVTPNFAIDATEYRVKGKHYSSEINDAYHDISNTKLAFLKDLSENAQLQLDQLYHRTKYIRSDLSASATDTDVNDAIIHIEKDTGGDVSQNKIYVTGHIIPKYGETYDLGSEENPFNAIYLKKNTIYFDERDDDKPPSSMSFNTVTGTLDISYNDLSGSTVLSYNNKVRIGHYPTNREPTANLDVSGTTYITGDVSLNSKLFVTDDATLSSKLFVHSDVSMASILMVADDVSLNSKLFVVDDVSFNSKLSVAGDVSMNKNVDICGNLIIYGNLSVYQQKETMIINTTINNYEILATKDISLNGNLVVSADVSLNSKLFVVYDVSFNSKLSLGNNLEMKVEEDAGYGFILQY